MTYSNIVPGRFISRPNRFVAEAEIGGAVETVHVKNTGRCRELLVPGARIYLSVSENPLRKTKFDLVAVEKEREGKAPMLVNMDSQAPNACAEEWLGKSGILTENAVIRREVTFGKSRFDLFVRDGDRRVFVEVKGVTLENDSVAAFPDAPTERGVKHLTELTECLSRGYEAMMLFVVQMKPIRLLRPNDETHKAFGDALRKAREAGVRVIAVGCTVTPDSLTPDCVIPVEL